MKKYTLSFLAIVILSSFSFSVFAKITLPKVFTDNMVLQQKTEAPLWGKASPGKTVTIVTSWDKKSYTTTTAGNGDWQAKVTTPEAGGPYEISFSDGKKLTLNNILIGEVWICSGQSNMEMPLAGWGMVNDYKNEIANADYPQIRLLHVEQATSNLPIDDLKETRAGWRVCSPETIADFSSVAYFFGRDLYKNLNVPIGLISTSWGGTIAEAWTSGAALEEMPYFKDAVNDIRRVSAEKVTVDLKAPQQVKENPNRPTVLYNAMIHPIVPYAIQGAIWYQGESNSDRAYQYRELFPLMIRDWRKQWNKNFPFYFVQLANFMAKNNSPEESQWAELREAQLQTLNLENTGMAVTIDIGDAEDIHPKNKQDVGLRLALNAQAKTYGMNITYSGPIFDSYRIEGNKIRIHFEQTGSGLRSKNNATLKGFAIAGPDHKFYWADAEIEGNDVIVSSPNVNFPTAVRYAWANNPECNLYNVEGLPASPFRTDDWR